jgi:hypothetical protein
MTYVSSPDQGLDKARAYLLKAQDAAEQGFNTPGAATKDLFVMGAHNAQIAASMLAKVEPRSKYQDLKLASSFALEGAAWLNKAAELWTKPAPVLPLPTMVKQYSDAAFDSFEGAFEIIDND